MVAQPVVRRDEHTPIPTRSPYSIKSSHVGIGAHHLRDKSLLGVLWLEMDGIA